ncbi:type IV secretory system conjugative DNA transfer family protein [Paenibacillus illinoisensis]|uniref:type IV secretory system conjugative DNA transfer family protein n=1 Tax=Paenibacillus illinoisensis TaxID=59845 RepID=UPI001C8E5F7C|nr:type IV secretory system conjugative DNA transfer family protein [Paenibacillus illinoisensis]MBY0217953.1 type IV secretion system DNA-binding domain-containing protein [Paenibacillus illinoisensis]
MEKVVNQHTDEQMPPQLKSFLRKWWVDHRERMDEWYRIYFHTIVVSMLIVINLWLGFSSFLIFFAQWFNVDSGTVGFLSVFFEEPPVLLVMLLDLIYVPLHHYQILWILMVLNLPILTWLYSTVTQPIMRGYNTLISWTSKRGRVAAAILSGIPFLCSFTAIFSWYVRNYLFDFFVTVQSDKDYLVVRSMESFGFVLMCIPVLISLFAVYFVAKEFYRNEDLQLLFYKWEFSLLASQSFSLRGKSSDVIVGWEKESNKPIVLTEGSRYLHELIVGATGTGKTSTSILIRIVQDLIRIARGRKLGVVVLEPKGDLIRDVQKLCRELGIPDHKIKIVDPTDLVQSIKFNPFVGPLDSAAETFRGVLDALAGDQDEFFKGQQSETASLYTMLGKIRYGDIFSIVQMQQMYTDPRYLANITEEVRRAIVSEQNDPGLDAKKKAVLQRYDRIVSYFETEVLEYKTFRDKEQNVHPVTYSSGHKYEGQQIVENKKDKYVAGGKKYLNDIVMNEMLSQLMVANEGEEALDIDQFLQEGGVLLVNTALGELEELSLSFGQFFIRQFQSSVFRRPPEENGYKRCPIFFNIDEFPLYINEAFVRLLTLGRSFKVGTLIAIQSLGQLKAVVQGYDNTVLNSARNKTVFGGGEYEDNERFSNNFGEEVQVEESSNESTTPVSMPNQSWGMRYNMQRTLAARFTPTDIKEQEFKHFIVDFVDADGSVKAPTRAYGKFITETKYLSKFVNIGKIEFETKDHKPLAIAAHKLAHIHLLKPLFGDKVTEEDTGEDESSDIIESTQQNEPDLVELLPTSPSRVTQDHLEEEQPLTKLDSSVANVVAMDDFLRDRGQSTHVPLSESAPLLIPMDEEETINLTNSSATPTKAINLSPEEEEEYHFYSETVPEMNMNPIINEVVSEDEDSKYDQPSTDRSLSLPEGVEHSLNDLFVRLGHTNMDSKDAASEPEQADSDEGWGIHDIEIGQGHELYVTDPTKEDIAHQLPIIQDPPSQVSNNFVDPELSDLVATGRGSRTMQREIASSRITKLDSTVIDDD